MKRLGSPLKIVLTMNALALLLLAAWAIHNNKPNDTQKNSGADTYPYLSKRIFAEKQNDLLINFTPLRQAMRDYEAKVGEDKLRIYFEYLPTGTSISINGQEETTLASLIKIPVTMATYKAIENNELALDQKLTLKKEDLDPRYGELWKRGVGSQISVQEAVEMALIKSDNTATLVLSHNLKEDTAEDVFDALDIERNRANGYAVVSPKNYTSILKSLYLASYLNRDNSNKLLDTLIRTDFNDNRISQSVPDNVKVAHKVAIFEEVAGQPQVYSDCGIVYAPSRPYSLCIMTQNIPESESTKHMQQISKMIYGYVSVVNK